MVPRNLAKHFVLLLTCRGAMLYATMFAYVDLKEPTQYLCRNCFVTISFTTSCIVWPAYSHWLSWLSERIACNCWKCDLRPWLAVEMPFLPWLRNGRATLMLNFCMGLVLLSSISVQQLRIFERGVRLRKTVGRQLKVGFKAFQQFCYFIPLCVDRRGQHTKMEMCSTETWYENS